jgi:hypothetical protein
MGEGVTPERMCYVVCGHVPYRSAGVRGGRCVGFGDEGGMGVCRGRGATEVDSHLISW